MSRWGALVVLCAGTLMIIVDQTVVGVALPVIRADLDFSATGLAWVVNAYVIPFGGVLLLAGRIGDLLGRKRVFLAGMVVFTVASGCCGLAPFAGFLVAARFVQGVGGAMVAAVSLGMVVPLFPDARERARALGLFSFVQAGGGALGSLLGGVVTEAVSWSWIFYANLPIGLLTLVFAVRLAGGRGAGGAADVLGGALVTGGLVLAVSAIVGGSWVAAVVAVVLLAGFVVRERRFAAPLLPPAVFRSVAGVNAVLGLLTAAMFAFLFFVVLHLGALGYSALGTGLAMVPVAVAIGTVSLVLSARLNERFGERRVLLAGLTLVAAGLGALALVTDAVAIQGAMVLLGTGFGAAMPALMALGMAGATDADAGLLSGLFGSSQQVGGALGLSVLVAVSHGHRASFLLSACLVVGALVTAAVVLRQKDSDRSALSASSL